MRYAIIGLGPVGKRLHAEANKHGHEVVWFDSDASVHLNEPRAGTVLDAVRAADRVISAVPASASASVARSARPALADQAVFEDWTSATPAEKRTIAGFVGARYLDVTLLDSITTHRPQICAAGDSAELVVSELEGFGFEALVAGPDAGDAAVVKMVRSLFMKPFEALTIELLRTAAKWDPNGLAAASIERTLRTPFPELASMLVETNRLHAGRRAEELSEVISSVALPSGQDLLRAAQEYLVALNVVWSSPNAPKPGSVQDELLAYLGAGPYPDDDC